MPRDIMPTQEDALAPFLAELDIYIDAMHVDLSRSKVGIINDAMKLSDAESARFWPIYQEYEDELFALADHRVQLLDRYLRLGDAGPSDDHGASEIAAGLLTYETERVELVRKYHSEIEREFTPLRGVQFLQIEHRTQTIVDLLVARHMPLVQAAAPTAVQ